MTTQAETIQIPKTIGYMALPQTVLFPHNLLPLHIYETHYRNMLQHALQTHRMFAILLLQPNGTPATHGTIGLIRACVTNPDGTSNLILQGTTRIQATPKKQTPYPQIQIQPIPTTQPHNNPKISNLAHSIQTLIHQIHHSPCKEIKTFLSDLKDYDMMIDVISGCFLNEVQHKQKLIETRDLETRLAKLRQFLQLEYQDQPPEAA